MKMIRVFILLLSMSLFASLSFAQDNKTDKKKKTEEVTFTVNMTCGNCKTRIEKHISWEKGVKDLKVNLNKKQVTIKYDPSKTNEEMLQKAIESLEYNCEKTE